MTLNREIAAHNKFDTYQVARRCLIDGCRTRNTHTHKCTECERYAQSIKGGRIEGIDGRIDKKNPKQVKAKWNTSEGWSDQQREIHAEAVRKGKRLAKERKEALKPKLPIPDYVDM